MKLRAAIKIDGGIVTGHTHSDCLMKMEHACNLSEREEGFVTEDGEFMFRMPAMDYAIKHDLLKPDYTNHRILFSYMLK